MAVGCLAGCGDSEDPQPAEKTVHRTVLVYMVADNSLGSWGCDRSDIEEMVKAADAGGLNGSGAIRTAGSALRAKAMTVTGLSAMTEATISQSLLLPRH